MFEIVVTIVLPLANLNGFYTKVVRLEFDTQEDLKAGLEALKAKAMHSEDLTAK